jgi:hypothetical protein
VGINEAGEKRGVAKVDDFSPGGDRSAWANSDNFATGHDDKAGSDQRVALSVEKSRGFQDIGFRCGIWCLPVSRSDENYTDEKNPEKSIAHETLSNVSGSRWQTVS